MLTKRSRYYRLDDTEFPDHAGIERRCKALRRVSAVDGQFVHTLEASDRLDHLAYKYYRQSLHWWRICDANPQFATPLALLGKTVNTVLSVTLSWDDSVPPLSELYDTLASTVGMERVDKGDHNGVPEIEVRDGTQLFTLPGVLKDELKNAVRTQVMPVSLNTALAAEGLVLPAGLRFKMPADNLWQIELAATSSIYRFHYNTDTGLIGVNPGLVRYRMVLLLTYNRNTVDRQSIIDQITSLGFYAENIETLTRVGQGVVIPPRCTGKD